MAINVQSRRDKLFEIFTDNPELPDYIHASVCLKKFRFYIGHIGSVLVSDEVARVAKVAVENSITNVTPERVNRWINVRVEEEDPGLIRINHLVDVIWENFVDVAYLNAKGEYVRPFEDSEVSLTVEIDQIGGFFMVREMTCY